VGRTGAEKAAVFVAVTVEVEAGKSSVPTIDRDCVIKTVQVESGIADKCVVERMVVVTYVVSGAVDVGLEIVLGEWFAPTLIPAKTAATVVPSTSTTATITQRVCLLRHGTRL
jgi:hypothetical protein